MLTYLRSFHFFQIPYQIMFPSVSIGQVAVVLGSYQRGRWRTMQFFHGWIGCGSMTLSFPLSDTALAWLYPTRNDISRIEVEVWPADEMRWWVFNWWWRLLSILMWDRFDGYTVAYVFSNFLPHFFNFIARSVLSRIFQSPFFIAESLQLGSSEFAASEDK